MANIQAELLKLILENDNPEEAILIALDIVTSLRQSAPSQVPSVASLQVTDLQNQVISELMVDLF